MIERREGKSDKPYKEAFVDFIKSREWHWFITIPIGLCRNDDMVLKRLRAIESVLCGKYLVNRYQKLPDKDRFTMVVAFEGETKCGTRHAHILAHVPLPTKRRISRSMMISLFPFEFQFLWNKLSLLSAPAFDRTWVEYPWGKITFGKGKSIYAVKDVRQAEVPWSRFESVTPPKFKTFKNDNLSVCRNRDRQRRAVLGLAKA